MAMMLFCRHIIINRPSVLQEKGPLLIASNHPNSFLDAVIFDALFEPPIWSLARGDVFKHKFIIKILTWLKILPVYRVSEGVENLGANYQTFESCRNIFRKNGVVLIFTEGRCINEWHLRTLKKGTARLALSSWADGIPLRILPVGINYSSFRRFGKNMFINFGNIIQEQDIPREASEGLRIQAINRELVSQFGELVYEIEKKDLVKQKSLLERKPNSLETILLALPAMLGWMIHLPLYLPLRLFTKVKANHNDHYDSILTALLLFSYPFYLLLLSIILFIFTQSWLSFLAILIIPFTAWATVRLKPQLDYRGK